MFSYNNKTYKISMIEHDYGVELPIIFNIEGGSFSQSDVIRISIYKEINTEPKIVKDFEIVDNTISFKLTESETELLPVGKYYYDIDLVNNGSYLNNLLPKKQFIVLEKAGE